MKLSATQLAARRPRAHARADLARELERRAAQCRQATEALQRETRRRTVLEQRLSEVLRRKVSDQEEERRRIARELHDTLGQSLTLLRLGLEGTSQAPCCSEEARQRLTALKTLAEDAGRELHRLAWEIRPAALDDFGIEPAVRSLLENWSERCNIRFDLHLMLDGRPLPSAIGTTLYRVLQEALTNVVRHAEASLVGVTLGFAEGHLTLVVEDDGRGFRHGEKTGPAVRRLGLVGIRERISLVGGSFEIDSAPGKGTTLFVRIPF